MEIVETQKTSRKRAQRPREKKRRRMFYTPRKVKQAPKVRTEIKTFDYTYSDSTPYEIPLFTSITGDDDFLTADATGGMTCINVIRQGAQDSQRIGSKITLKSIRTRATIVCTTSSTNSIRIVLLCDKQCNGAYPTISDIFQDNVSSTTTFNSSLKSSEYLRYIVLRDLVYTFTSGNNLSKVMSKIVKKKLQITFQSDDGDIGDLAHNAIYILAGSSTYTTDSDCIHIKFSTRIRYYDF